MLSTAIIHSVSAVTVWSCRVAIGATATLWFIQDDWLSLCVACVALLLTFPAAQFLRERRLRDTTATLTSLLLTAHIVLGMQLGLYETSKFYDKAMHLIGSGAVAAILIVSTQTYAHRTRVSLPNSLLHMLVFTGTVSVGTTWEIFEFAVDRTGLFVAQRGLRDTMLDLIANALGAGLILSIFAGSRSESAYRTAGIAQQPALTKVVGPLGMNSSAASTRPACGLEPAGGVLTEKDHAGL